MTKFNKVDFSLLHDLTTGDVKSVTQSQSNDLCLGSSKGMFDFTVEQEGDLLHLFKCEEVDGKLVNFHWTVTVQ